MKNLLNRYLSNLMTWTGESSNRRCNKMLLFYSASAQGAGKSQKVF